MNRSLLSIAMIGLLSGFGASRGTCGAPEKKQDATPVHATASLQSPGSPVESNFVGAEVCATCHADESKSFGANPHSHLALMHNGTGATCESCHGPGKAHVDAGGDPTKIFQFSKASEKQVDAKCLSCHASAHPNFERSAHGEADVGCTSCHSVHNSKGEGLLKVSQPKLCYGCHTDVKPSFAQPFHHKVDEGLMKCSDCHDPHGTFQRNQLRSTADQNDICTKCHTETAGPFVFEHPVVKSEGCVACHSPHGSPNARLLNVAKVNTLCLSCHSSTNLAAFPNAVSEQGGPVHNQATQYVSCTNCHTQIHGSNVIYNFFR